MNCRTALVLGFLVLLTSWGASQTTIQVPSTPVTPGVPFKVVLTNNTSICIDTSVSNILTLLQPDGELIAPVLVGCGPVAMCLANGGKANLTYTAPASGPGSAGSFVLLCPHGSGAAARLDVGKASPVFPDIHCYPTAIPKGPGGHHIPFPAGTSPEWEFSNTAGKSHVISPTLRIFTPGGTAPVATAPLPNLNVPANGLTRVSLPLSRLGPGPYTVEATWFDPGMKSTISVRHGIHVSSIMSLDLHFPGGRVVPRGGSIPARLAVPQGSHRPPTPWYYVLAVGYLPGTLPLPGGVILPLTLDPLVVASVTNGVGGLLKSNAGNTTSAGVYCAHSMTYFPVATGITIAHPGAVLSGLRLRVGALAVNPGTGPDAASQPEEIVLQ